jgi:hypothetical protein
MYMIVPAGNSGQQQSPIFAADSNKCNMGRFQFGIPNMRVARNEVAN